MHSYNKQVNITQAANGFIVQLYGRIERPHVPMNTIEASIKAGLEIMKRYKKSEQLDNLGLDEQEPSEEIRVEEPLGDLHVFPTWEQVSEFLEYYFKNGK